MKKITTFMFSLALAFIFQKSNAQTICVTKNNVTTVYADLNSAVSNAPDSAYIYMSGGNFFLSADIIISQTLYFVGAGYCPDSTIATNKTIISGLQYVTLNDGASGSSFTGIDFANSGGNGCINATNSTATLSNISISRCIFENNFAGAGLSQNVPANIFNFGECIFNAVFNGGNGVQDVAGGIFNNCLFLSFINNFTGSTFNHCTFDLPSSTDWASGISSTFINCALLNTNISTWDIDPLYPIIFTQCITNDTSLPTGSSGSGNLFNVAAASFYVNGSSTFTYSNDYHLVSTSPGHNYATDGTDVGIYGSAYPFKTGGVPYNPHFFSAVVAPSTDASGNLSIQLSTEAQTR